VQILGRELFSAPLILYYDTRMIPDPERVQAVFLAAVDYLKPTDRAAVLDRECSVDMELRRRVEALLRAHDQLNSILNDGSTSPLTDSG
jgi:hypothetical protein